MSLSEEVAALMTWGLANKYPHVPRKDHKLIVSTTLDNYFSRDGVMAWYKENAKFLTPDVLAEIRSDLHHFFYCESHLVGEGYIPLCERENFRAEKESLAEMFGPEIAEAMTGISSVSSED